MSLIRTMSLACDYDDCPQWIGHGDETAEQLRTEAKRTGWTRPRVDGKRVDWCDRHAVKDVTPHAAGGDVTGPTTEETRDA